MNKYSIRAFQASSLLLNSESREASNMCVLLAQAVGVPVGWPSAGRLATTLVATKDIFHPPFLLMLMLLLISLLWPCLLLLITLYSGQ